MAQEKMGKEGKAMLKAKTKKNTFDSILNVFAWLSFFVAVILALAVFFSSFSGTDNGRSIFGYKMLIVESNSMSKSELSKDEPISFNKDDLIFVKEVSDMTEIKVGDVITFVSYNPGSVGKTLSHKVRSIKTNSSGIVIGFETYGIYTGVSDQVIVDPSTVIGKYVGQSEALGHLFCFFKTPPGYFTSILIPCVLLIIFFSIKVGKIITKREMHRVYYDEFEMLRNRISELERNKGEIMQADLQTMENSSTMASEAEQQVNPEQVSSVCAQPNIIAQPYIQIPNNNDKVLEIMANTLGKAMDSLTRTIDTLAASVGKPVDALSRSVETLANANAKIGVVERIVEKPVIQTIIKESAVEPAKEKAKEEIALTKDVVKEEPAKEQVEEVQEVEQDSNATGNMFSEFKQHEKVAFSKKLLSLDKDVKEYFSEVHNELISHKKVNHRISFKGITYRSGRKALAKMVVRGKTLKLHLALNVDDYPRTVFFQQDSGNVKAYEDVPFTVKIKSERGKNNAIKLVNSLAENNSLKKDEKFVKENILKEIKQFK